MLEPSIPKNENERLNELYDSGLLDTPKESDFDNLTNLASSIFGAPVSIITLVDENRQWFKSCFGLPEEITETPREISFCGHAINNPSEVLVIPDARLDNIFSDNPLVSGDPNIVFYAGAPLISKNGYPLGTFCIIDFKPRTLSQQDVETLKILSNQVSKLIDLRLSNEELTESLKEKSLLLKEVHHRVKNNLQLVSSLLRLQANSIDNEDFSKAIVASQERIKSMAIVHEKLYQSKSLAEVNIKSYFDALIEEKSKVTSNKNINYSLEIPNEAFKIEKLVPIGLLINEMITNSYKHAFHTSNENTISIQLLIDPMGYCMLKYEDNGTGLDEDYNIINPQSIGMDLIDSFVDQLDGKLELRSTNKGVVYTISFQK
ncbi:MAG: GAF domain-containing protein [Flavobacteriales bacterium]|nr:GAF domain-containing protein [Flavobacteriales bacterium]